MEMKSTNKKNHVSQARLDSNQRLSESESDTLSTKLLAFFEFYIRNLRTCI